MKKPKIFISWSGIDSKKYAVLIREWLDEIFIHTESFFSEVDIAAGQLWLSEVHKNLADSVFGIGLINKDNVHSPWVHYEAGAIAAVLNRNRFVPLLCGIHPTEIGGSPLVHLQSKSLTEEGLAALANSINEVLLDYKLSDRQIEKAAQRVWQDFKARIEELENLSAPDLEAEKIFNIEEEIKKIKNGILNTSRKNEIYMKEILDELTKISALQASFPNGAGFGGLGSLNLPPPPHLDTPELKSLAEALSGDYAPERGLAGRLQRAHKDATNSNAKED